jgi:hypothetical protein
MEGSSPIRIFSDPKLEWMKTYSADQGRWSLSFYAFDSDGVIQRLHREVDPAQAGRLLSEMIQSLGENRD